MREEGSKGENSTPLGLDLRGRRGTFWRVSICRRVSICEAGVVLSAPP